jgi:hypothetical protein
VSCLGLCWVLLLGPERWGNHQNHEFPQSRCMQGDLDPDSSEADKAATASGPARCQGPAEKEGAERSLAGLRKISGIGRSPGLGTLDNPEEEPRRP